MSHEIEPMDVDDFGEYSSVLKETTKTPNKFQYYNDFENKENSYNANIVDDRFKIAAGDKTFDAFDDSCTNMKLRWSCTPGSSPVINRSSYDTLDRSMNNSLVDNSNSTFRAVDFENGNAILSSHNCSSEVQDMDISLDNSRITIVEHTSSTNISLDSCKNNTLLQEQSIESNKVPNISINHLAPVKQDVASPLNISIENENQFNSKDKQGASSPILRGIKSVINMFRPSQSPITASGTPSDCAKDLNNSSEKPSPAPNRSNEKIIAAPDKRSERKNSITNRTFEVDTKKDGLEFVTVFKEDFINDIQWNDDSTIIFNTKKALKSNRVHQDGESHSLSGSSRLSAESQGMQSGGSSLGKVCMNETYDDNIDHSLNNERTSKLQSKLITEETQSEMKKIQNEKEDTNNFIKHAIHASIVDKNTDTINSNILTENKLLENKPSQELSGDKTQPAATVLVENVLTETFLHGDNNIQDVSEDFSESITKLKDPNPPDNSSIFTMTPQENVLQNNFKSTDIIIGDETDQKTLIREENDSPIEEFEDCLDQLSDVNGLALSFETPASISESLPTDYAKKCDNILLQKILQNPQIQNLDSSNVCTTDLKQNMIDKTSMNTHTVGDSELLTTTVANSQNMETRKENDILIFSHKELEKSTIITDRLNENDDNKNISQTFEESKLFTSTVDNYENMEIGKENDGFISLHKELEKSTIVTDCSNTNDDNQNVPQNDELSLQMKVNEKNYRINSDVDGFPIITTKDLSSGINTQTLTEKVNTSLNASNVLETDNNTSHTDNTAVNNSTCIDLTQIKLDVQSNKITVEMETELCSGNKNTLVDKTEVFSKEHIGDPINTNITECLNIDHLPNEDIDYNMKVKECTISTENHLNESNIKMKNADISQENFEIITEMEINSSTEIIHPNYSALEQSIPVEIGYNEIESPSINLNTKLEEHVALNETVTLDTEIDSAKDKSEVNLNNQCFSDKKKINSDPQEIKTCELNGSDISYSEHRDKQNVSTLQIETNTNTLKNNSNDLINEAVSSKSQLDGKIDLNDRSDAELANVNMHVDPNISYLSAKSVDNNTLAVSQSGNFENIANQLGTKTNILPKPDFSNCDYGFENTFDPFKSDTKIRLSADREDYHLNSSSKEVEARVQSPISYTESGIKMDLNKDKMDIDEYVPDTVVLGNNIANILPEHPKLQESPFDIPISNSSTDLSDHRDTTNFSQNATTLSVSLDTVKSDTIGEMQSNKMHISDLQEKDEPVVFQPTKASTSNDLETEMNFYTSPQMKTNKNAIDEPEDVEIKEIMQSKNLDLENPFVTRTKIRMSPNNLQTSCEYKEMSTDVVENPFITRSKVNMSPDCVYMKSITQTDETDFNNAELTREVALAKEKKLVKEEKQDVDQVYANTTSTTPTDKQPKNTPHKQKRLLIRKSQGNNISATPKKVVTPIVDTKNAEKIDFQTIENPFTTRTNIRMSPTLNEMQNNCIGNLQNTNGVLTQTTEQTNKQKTKQTENQTSEQIAKVSVTVDSPPKKNTSLKVTPVKKVVTPIVDTKNDEKIDFQTIENPFVTRTNIRMSPTLNDMQNNCIENLQNTNGVLTQTTEQTNRQKMKQGENQTSEQIAKVSVTVDNKSKQNTSLKITPAKKVVMLIEDTKNDEKFDFHTTENPFVTHTNIRMSPTSNNIENNSIENLQNMNGVMTQTTAQTNKQKMEQTENQTNEQITKVSVTVNNPSKQNISLKVTPAKQKEKPLHLTEQSLDTNEDDNPFVTRSKMRISPSLDNQQIHNIITESENISLSQKFASDEDVKIKALNETVTLNIMNKTTVIESNATDISNPFVTQSKERLSPSLENQQIHNITIDFRETALHKLGSDTEVKKNTNVLNETVDLYKVNETKIIESNDMDISNPFATLSKVRLSPSPDSRQIHKVNTESERISTLEKSSSDTDIKTISNVLNSTVTLDKINETKKINSNDIGIASQAKIRASSPLDVMITNGDRMTMNSTIENGETTYIKKSDSVLEISQIINKNETINTTVTASEERKDNSLNISSDQTFDKSVNATILNTGQQNESPKGSLGYIQQLVNQVSNIIKPSHKLPPTTNESTRQNGQKHSASSDMTMKQDENDEEFAPAEMFFKDEAIDYLMNQTTTIADQTSTITDRGKDSLFIKFDPLYASSGKSNIDRIDAASTSGNVSAKSRLSGSFHEKPVLAVSPAVNSDQIKPVIQTPPRQESSTPRFVSPAIAAIDKLISLGGSPVRGSPPAMLVDVRDTSSANYFQKKMEAAQRLLSEREEEYKKKVSDLEKSNADQAANIKVLEAKLAEQSKQNSRMIKLNEEYEQTILSLLSKRDDGKKKHEDEISKLTHERDEQTAHLSSMEHSFNDLHAKYEKCKSLILSYKSNEEILKKRIADSEASCKKLEEVYEQIKKHATTKLNEANQTLETMKKAHNVEIVKLNALIKRKDLDISSLQETLTQKIKDNEALESICDELLIKVG